VPFTLDEIVPWGRSFDEYRRMFALSDRDLAGFVLGCGDGPASFNAELTRRGGRIVSCDPLYRWRAPDIRQRIDATFERVIEQTRQNAGAFNWDGQIRSVEALGEVRMTAMRAFLRDFAPGEGGGRYAAGELPNLPFANGTFDLAVCSHLLFLYSEQLSESLHVAAVSELCRVAADVRIFPLVDLNGRRSPHVASVTAALTRSGHGVSLDEVPYEFQRGANQMMRIRAKLEKAG
jgi:hypothetical protein